MAIETLPHMFESMIKTEGPNAHLINEMFTNPLNVNLLNYSKNFLTSSKIKITSFYSP